MMSEDLLNKLERRLGRLHARQRLGIEADHEAQIFGQGLNFFHIENWYSVHSVIRTALKLTGLYGRGTRNAERVRVRDNDVWSQRLPAKFDGFTLLHISDMHSPAVISSAPGSKLSGFYLRCCTAIHRFDPHTVESLVRGPHISRALRFE
jgi:hypothetical protein